VLLISTTSPPINLNIEVTLLSTVIKFFLFQVKTENYKMISVCNNDTYASCIQKFFLESYALFDRCFSTFRRRVTESDLCSEAMEPLAI